MADIDPYIVTGCANGVYPRLEISDLQKDEFQWSLFVRAFNELKKPGYKPAAASWESLGGIHGLPYSRWRGDPNSSEEPDKDAQWQGYCHHQSVLFPTWHRVDLLLVEQALSYEAKIWMEKNIRLFDPYLAEWTTAVKALRLPFWDWTATKTGVDGLPEICWNQPRVTVLSSNGTDRKFYEVVTNPLDHYEFSAPIPGAEDPPKNPDGTYQEGSFFKSWTRTYRWPSQDPVNPSQDFTSLNASFTKDLGTDAYKPWAWLRSKVANLFNVPVRVNDDLKAAMWDVFSNTKPVSYQQKLASAASDITPTLSSLEEPHNKVHNDIGAYGHMGDNNVAGFEPMFYLHHCNVDRIYALWEYVYPDYVMGDGWLNQHDQVIPFEMSPNAYADGTYTEDSGATLDHATSLTPFRRKARVYWNSDDVYSLAKGVGVNKGYTYPTITVGDVTIDVYTRCDPSKREAARNALLTHFEGVPSAVLRGDSDEILAKPPLFNVSPTSLTGELSTTHTVISGYRRFVVVGQVLQSAFNGSHTLELWLDGTPVNDISVLSRTDPSKCSACVARNASKARVRGVMVISNEVILQLLERHGKNTPDTTEDEIIALIKANMSARIIGRGRKLLAESAPGLAATPHLYRTSLDQEKRPFLTMFSASAVVPRHETIPGVPFVSFAGWKDHETVLGGEHDWSLPING